VHLAAQVDRDEEVIEEGEVVGCNHRRALHRDLVRVDAAGPVEEHEDRGEEQPHDLVDGVGALAPRLLVEAREVLLGAGILVDLRLHWGFPTQRSPNGYSGRAQTRARSSERPQSPRKHSHTSYTPATSRRTASPVW